MRKKALKALNSIQTGTRNLWGRLTRFGRPVFRQDVVLIAPFDEEKDALGRLLMAHGNLPFDAEARVQPLSKSGALLYNLPGFYTDAGGTTRACLGLPALKGFHHTKHPMNTEMAMMENAVGIVALDPTLTPLPKEALKSDIPMLKQRLGDRCIFVFIHHNQFRSWPAENLRKRQEIWEDLLGEDVERHFCDTETLEGFPAVVDAITRAR